MRAEHPDLKCRQSSAESAGWRSFEGSAYSCIDNSWLRSCRVPNGRTETPQHSCFAPCHRGSWLSEGRPDHLTEETLAFSSFGTLGDHNVNDGSSFSADMTRGKLQETMGTLRMAHPPGLMPPQGGQTQADAANMEFSNFWGHFPWQEQQGDRDEWHDFWHGFDFDLHDACHDSFQDFHAALQTMTSKPAPVPSPATHRASSVAEDDFSDVSLRRGEDWRGPLPAWSPDETTSSRRGRTKQVEHEHKHSKVVKRAYKRACKRAIHAPSGYTWYRGRWLSGAMLKAQDVSQLPEIPAQVMPICNRRLQVRPHYSLLTWNFGGLAANNWDALQYWLHLHNIHICCIQETRWNLVSEWCNGQFYVFHSGSGRSGGLMTLVSTRLAPRGSIRTCTLANGRIQHTRVFRPNGSIDIVNIYQKVWSHDSVENIVAQRKVVWNALRELLDSLPARNQVMICGDMNTQLPFTKGVTGTAVGEQAYRDTRDEHELQSILRLHGLQAVNTFHDPSRHTFVGPGARTLLDYVFMRARQAGGLAKQAKGLHDFPLLAARGECYHVPVLAQFPKH